jgi:hypothetical protein
LLPVCSFFNACPYGNWMDTVQMKLSLAYILAHSMSKSMRK